ncbi:hypothetical protein FBU30_009425 [Linnemannia zychae]|nr:hypothetical protein FBU30_009425 [Linnemannia zychae]
MLPLQCRLCKDLLLNPVTLPCGFTVCQACLPPLQSIAFRQQIHCPFPACARSNIHSADELCIDVTLQSLTTAWRNACLQQDSQTGLCSPAGSLALSTDVSLESLTLTGNATSSEPATAPNYYRNIRQVMNTLLPKIQQETECQVCFLVFEQPLTTSCGHTLCKGCLITSLDHNPTCPLCRRKLPLYMFYYNQPVNKALVGLINFMNRQCANNATETLAGNVTTTTTEEQRDLDPTLAMTPLFINSLIFPRMPCYLLVFEPRYRRMLRNVLKTESKVFGMVLPPKQRKSSRFDIDELNSRWEPSREYGTLLKIVSLELLPDGRALVETVGLSRFQILTYAMLDGYYTATAVEMINDISEEQERGLEKAALDVAAHKEEQIRRAMLSDKVKPLESFTAYRNEKSDSDAESSQDENLSRDKETEAESLDRRWIRDGQRSLPSSLSSHPLALSERPASTSTNPASQSSPSSSSDALPPQLPATIKQSTADGDEVKEEETVLELKDLHNVELESISQKQMMQILQGFVAHMQDRLGPLQTQRLEREFGEMVEDDGRLFSFWVGSILPVGSNQKYELLKQTSVRRRLQMVLEWIREIEARRSYSVCSIQ